MTLARPAARRIRRDGRATDSPSSITVDDGRVVIVRTLTSADAPELAAFLDDADADDLRRRFMGQPPPRGFLLSRLCAADGFHDLVIGAFDGSGRLVAVAQFDRDGDGPVAEVAIEVARDWQRHRLGTQLMLRLGELAHERGITTFTATYFADNVGIRRLLRDTGRLVSTDVTIGEGFSRLDLER